MFAFEDSRGAVDVAFTDRHGGVSAGAYGSLNLAQTGGDDAVATAENLRRATEAFTARAAGDDPVPWVVRMHQVHGAQVTVVDEPRLGEMSSTLPVCDGLVTALRGVVLVVRAADCVPVLLCDADAGVVGAAHAGRQGMVDGVVPATVARMRALGARSLTAWIGPHVCGRCYEVPELMREQVAAAVPQARAETSWGTPAVDVGAGVCAQLERDGVAVVDASRCTVEHEDLFSYRRQGAASGRMAGLVWVRP